MISYVKGPLVDIEEDVIVMETGSLGLAVHMSVSLPPELPRLGQEATVYTYFQVREDTMTLYGFLHPQDRGMFRQLLGVSGIRPKGALGVLPMLRPDDLRLTIVSEDVKALAKAPGIGTKTVQRMILDLKDKISMDGVLGSVASGADLGTGSGAAAMTGLARAAKEVVQALVALGHTNSEVSRTVKQVEIVNGMTSEDVLKASLEHLSSLRAYLQWTRENKGPLGR